MRPIDPMNQLSTGNKTRISIKSVLSVILFILALLLQYSLGVHISVLGVTPDMPLVIVMVIGIVSGSVFGGAAGLAAGLYRDSMVGKILGMYALFGLYSGVLSGLLSKKHKNENVVAVIFITYIVSVFYETCVYIFGYVIPIIRNGGEAKAGIIYAYAGVILPEAMFNTLIGIPIFLLLKARKFKENRGDLDVPAVY